MRKVKIIEQIDIKVFKNRGPIERWNIGVTDNPVGTRLALMSDGHDVANWQQWKADNTLDAQAVNKLFVMLGMNEIETDDLMGTPATIYVF
ncbi:MAG: hypothetical protein R3178_05915 [Rhodothermales bacterium]|nr:hypothetical protein [Rhodothermales bacterium]